MAELAVQTKKLDFHLEQVQDFTPTPMTVSTETWYTGYDPYTLEPVFSAHTPKEKLAQRMFFFWYKPEERRNIEYELKKIGRSDLISQLYGNKGFAPAYSTNSRQDTTEHRTAGMRDASSRDFTGRRDGSGRDFAGRKRFSSTQEPAVKNKGKRYVPTDEAQNSRYAKDSNKGSRGRGRYKDNSSSKQRW